MKKLIAPLILFVAFLFTISSCSRDDENTVGSDKKYDGTLNPRSVTAIEYQ